MEEYNYKEKILSYIRSDGKGDAPICFLTIEDGKGYFEHDKSPEDIINELKKDLCKTGQCVDDYKKTIDALSKEKNTTATKRIGRLGINIAKTMIYLHKHLGTKVYNEIIKNDDMKHNLWENYKIYNQYEQNIKFFPISRRNVRQFREKPELWEAINKIAGFNSIEGYEEECKCKKGKRIKQFIDLKYGDNYVFSKNRLYIISARCVLEAWKNVMHELFLPALDFEYEYKTNIDAEFYRINGQLAFVYFSLFKKGRSDKQIEGFAKHLSGILPDSIREEIKCMTDD